MVPFTVVDRNEIVNERRKPNAEWGDEYAVDSPGQRAKFPVLRFLISFVSQQNLREQSTFSIIVDT